MLIPSSMRYIQKNIHVNIYVAVNLMIGGPDISGTGWMRVKWEHRITDIYILHLQWFWWCMQKGGNVNMIDKLCVEIYWNYQPFPTNIVMLCYTWTCEDICLHLIIFQIFVSTLFVKSNANSV
jgi:hypothetical protein